MTRPLAVIAAELDEIERAWHAPAVRSGEGNPNHDPATGQFTGAGGSTGHAKRKRRKGRRHRELHRLKRELRVEVGRQRREHAAWRKEIARDHARARADLRKQHGRERKEHVREERRERAALDRDQARDRKRLEGDRAAEHRRIEAHHEKQSAKLDAAEAEAKAKSETHPALAKIAGLRGRLARRTEARKRQAEARHADEMATLEEHHAFDRGVLHQSLREGRKTLRSDHKAERESLREDQREERAGHLDTMREERKEMLEWIRSEVADAGFTTKKKGAARGLRGGPDRGSLAGVDRGVPVRRAAIAPGRTHKAGSAESILRHCLRSLGLSAAYRRGELTGMQALGLLAEVREYARGWLRHEAEQLIRHYGRAVDNAEAEESSGKRHLGSFESPVFLPEEAGELGGQGGLVVGAERLCGECADRSLSSAMRRHVGRFFGRLRTFAREAIHAGAMALSGPEGLDDDDSAEADRQHAVQVAFLDRFEADVAARTPPELAEPSGLAVADAMSAAEFAKRASDYAGGVWSGAQGVDRRKAIRDGKAVAERRFHLNDDQRHACSVCLEQSDLGWQPIGTLLPVGDSTCLAIHCDCYYVYRLSDGSEFITARGWRRAA